MNPDSRRTAVEQTTDLEVRVKAYMEAFEERRLSDCLAFFDENATLSFHTSYFKGLSEIEGWHKDRFAADLRLIRVDNNTTDGDSVTIDAVGTSKRLQAWRINNINGVISIQFEGDKIRDLKFSPRLSPW